MSAGGGVARSLGCQIDPAAQRPGIRRNAAVEGDQVEIADPRSPAPAPLPPEFVLDRVEIGQQPLGKDACLEQRRSVGEVRTGAGGKGRIPVPAALRNDPMPTRDDRSESGLERHARRPAVRTGQIRAKCNYGEHLLTFLAGSRPRRLFNRVFCFYNDLC